MNRIHEFDTAKVESMTAAMIERVAFFEALFAEPEDHFIIRNDGSAGAPGDICSIGDVVGVAMRDEDIIGRNFVCINVARQFIAGYEWVEQQVLAADFRTET